MGAGGGNNRRRPLTPWRWGARRPREVEAAPRTSPVGTLAPVVAGVTPTGELTAIQPADGVVLMLTSSCLACRDVWAALASPQPEAGATKPAVSVVVTPSALEDRRAVAALAPEGVAVVMSDSAWRAYAAAGAPWVAVVIGGLVAAEGPAASWEDVVALVTGNAQRR